MSLLGRDWTFELTLREDDDHRKEDHLFGARKYLRGHVRTLGGDLLRDMSYCDNGE